MRTFVFYYGVRGFFKVVETVFYGFFSVEYGRFVKVVGFGISVVCWFRFLVFGMKAIF